jgi:hypothetical protein
MPQALSNKNLGCIITAWHASQPYFYQIETPALGRRKKNDKQYDEVAREIKGCQKRRILNGASFTPEGEDAVVGIVGFDAGGDGACCG